MIAQHIAAEFAPSLAQWLAARCRLPVRTARNGDTPAAGTVLVAASNDHLELAPDLGLRYTATPTDYPYRPSVDVLFIERGSGVAAARRRGAAHRHGLRRGGGLSRLRAQGWHTIAQDEATCVVYGMPKAAAEKRAAVEMLPLPQIGMAVAARVNQSRS